eukprot:COSAG06_NODE_6577_length_2872_cov_5.690003_2_plen_136_part_00
MGILKRIIYSTKHVQAARSIDLLFAMTTFIPVDVLCVLHTHLPAGEKWRAEHRKKFETRTRSSVASKLMQRRGAELLVEPYRIGSIGNTGGGGCGSWFGGRKQDRNSSGGGKENVLFESFINKNDLLTKTGSGQT